MFSKKPSIQNIKCAICGDVLSMSSSRVRVITCHCGEIYLDATEKKVMYGASDMKNLLIESDAGSWCSPK